MNRCIWFAKERFLNYSALAFLDVTPDSMRVGSGSGSAILNVSGNVDWTVTDDGSWLTAEKTSESAIKVNYNENTSENERTANITASGTDGISETITIKQDKKLPTNMNLVKDQYVLIYPNPAKDFIYIKTNETSLFDISVFVTDALGRLVYMNKYDQINVKEEKEIFISNLENGIYYVIVRNRNMNQIYKIIKD